MSRSRSSSKSSTRGKLKDVAYFERGRYPKKYVAVMKSGKRVAFGNQDYQQYKDSVPKRMGGGLWSHKDHGDKKRRQNYRARHGGQRTSTGKKAYTVKYSPAWFSYYYLW